MNRSSHEHDHGNPSHRDCEIRSSESHAPRERDRECGIASLVRRADEAAGGAAAGRVYFHTAHAAFEHPGGGEVQLLNTAEHLRKLGVDVKPFDPRSDRLSPDDWLHLFGTTPDSLAMARLAARCGVRVALSTISWYDPRAAWNLEPTPARKLRGVVGWCVRRTCPRMPSWRRELLHRADLLLPNSEAEARQLTQLFGVERSRIAVVPNGVDERFVAGDADLFRSRFGVSDFVLVPGRIEPRKNQLGVIRAMWGSGVPLVVLGDPHPDHAHYQRRCLREADASVMFVGRLRHDCAMLAAAYAAARVVVLASWFETPGLAALEGALAGSRIVVTVRGSANDYFGDLAAYVQPYDDAGIRAAIIAALTQPRSFELRNHIRQRFLWSEVARRTLAAYTAIRPVSIQSDRVPARKAA